MKCRKKPQCRNVDSLEQQFSSDFYSFSNFFQNLEMELHNAGIANSEYYNKCITYCREICSCFPDEDASYLYTFRKSIAEALFKLNHVKEAIDEFDCLVHDYPDDPWSYIAYGDAYLLSRDEKTVSRIKVKALYDKALLCTKDKNYIDIIMGRIDSIDN